MADNRAIVLVTGGNTGLGFEIVKALAKSEHTYEIVIGSRKISSGEAAVKAIQEEVKTSSTFSVLQVDLETDETLEKVVNELDSKFGRLDALVNNAGAQLDALVGQGKLTKRQMLNQNWDINVTGTCILSDLAIPLLLKSEDPRVLFLTSGTASLTETEMEGAISARLNVSPEAGWPKPPMTRGIPAYRSVKTGLNMMMRDYHRLLRNDGVKVWSISPGMLATGLGGAGKEKLREVSVHSGKCPDENPHRPQKRWDHSLVNCCNSWKPRFICTDYFLDGSH